MKKITTLLLIIITTLFLNGCSKKVAKPKDTNLEFWITERVDNVDFTSYQPIYGWMGADEYYGSNYIPIENENQELIDPEYYVKYLVTNYPDYASKHKAITRIVITDPNITFYGLTLTSTKDEINKEMKELGYQIQITDNLLKATKKNITFTFNELSIVIDAKVTNYFGIIY